MSWSSMSRRIFRIFILRDRDVIMRGLKFDGSVRIRSDREPMKPFICEPDVSLPHIMQPWTARAIHLV